MDSVAERWLQRGIGTSLDAERRVVGQIRPLFE